MFVQQGHAYMGGGDRGIFVSKLTAEGWLRANGFDPVRVYDRTELKATGAENGLPFDPRQLQGYKDDGWDTVVYGIRSWPSGEVEIAWPDRVKWVADLGHSVAPPQPGNTGPFPPGKAPPGMPPPVEPVTPAPVRRGLRWYEAGALVLSGGAVVGIGVAVYRAVGRRG